MHNTLTDRPPQGDSGERTCVIRQRVYYKKKDEIKNGGGENRPTRTT